MLNRLKAHKKGSWGCSTVLLPSTCRQRLEDQRPDSVTYQAQGRSRLHESLSQKTPNKLCPSSEYTKVIRKSRNLTIKQVKITRCP